jgi:hypothetical protein
MENSVRLPIFSQNMKGAYEILSAFTENGRTKPDVEATIVG